MSVTLQPLLDKQQLGKGFICRLYMYTYPRIAFVWFSIPEFVVISGHVAQASKTLVSYVLVRRLKASFFTSKTPHWKGTTSNLEYSKCVKSVDIYMVSFYSSNLKYETKLISFILQLSLLTQFKT